MIVFKLKELLEKNNMPRYRLQQYTDFSLKRINQFYFGTAQKVDVEELDILCEIFSCKLSDLVDYKKSRR